MTAVNECALLNFGARTGLFLPKPRPMASFCTFTKTAGASRVGQSVDVILQVDRAPPMSFVGSGLGTNAPGFGGFQVSIAPDTIWADIGRPMISDLTA